MLPSIPFRCSITCQFSGLFMTSAPNKSPACAISLQSVDINTLSIFSRSLLSLLNDLSMASINRKHIFPGSPLDPPRAKIKQRSIHSWKINIIITDFLNNIQHTETFLTEHSLTLVEFRIVQNSSSCFFILCSALIPISLWTFFLPFSKMKLFP